MAFKGPLKSIEISDDVHIEANAICKGRKAENPNFVVVSTYGSSDDPSAVQTDGHVGIGDVFLVSETILDVAHEVVRVRQVATLLNVDF